MSTIGRRRSRMSLVTLLHLSALALSLALCGCSLLPAPPTSAQATAVLAQPIDGFDTITPDQLPPQARRTLALIAHGGPFPYRQDGQVFQNRERRLPRQPGGYYHEYTVETPGSDDRGARRIITGRAGEIFYTDDHYASFVQVLPQ